MNSDINKSRLPSPVTGGSEVQGKASVLPPSVSIQLDEKISIARDEGFHPLAIELGIGSYETSAAQKSLQLALVITAAILVAFLFPFDRFFKPQSQELGTMTIGDPVSGNMSETGQPWLKALLEMDHLYFREGKHPDVVYRDKALNILDQDELINLKEAKVLKTAIYNHILDRWHWFEGQQVIQGMKQNRKALVEELKMLQKELKSAKSL